MESIDKILWYIDEEIKNVKQHSKDKRNNEIVLAYYKGYEAALKDLKKKTAKIKKEEEKNKIS